MFVLRKINTGELRHVRSVCQPSLVQGFAYILLLVCLACIITWLSSYRDRLECHAAAAEKPQNSSDKCPFTIRQLNKSTYLIRENDRFGEYPHIYVKEYTEPLSNGQTASIFIVNDTGCGTSTFDGTVKSRDWDIRTFIEHHLNPGGADIPYLVILSHCHYDHILGLEPILRSARDAGGSPSSQTIIMSSAYDRSFIEPRSRLREHSLCASMHLHCPAFKTTLWAHHNDRITTQHPKHNLAMHLPITALHTPGHTPDSLSWYDEDERALYVGDSFYERESLVSRAAPWGREAPAPILFPREGNLVHWWQSLNALMAFVEHKNALGGSERVALSSGHVTVGVDAATCLRDVKEFMKKVLRDDVGFEEKPEKRGERFGFWFEEGGRFSLGAPLRIIEEGRLGIAEKDWQNGRTKRSSCIVSASE